MIDRVISHGPTDAPLLLLQDDLMVSTGGLERLEVVLRRTRYRLEQAENDNADTLARSQRQVS